MPAYIHVERLNKNSVRHIYVNDSGELIREVVPYRQKIWEYSKDGTFKDIHGQPLKEITVDSLKEYVEEHQYLRGHDYAGELDISYQYIADKYPGKIEFDLDKIPKCYFDLEIVSKFGFPDPWEASQQILSIAFYLTKTGKQYVYGLKEYTGNDKEINFRKFRDEKEMVGQFLSIIHCDVGIIIGFNSDGFDIPYLINRSERVGVDLKLLLPLGKYYEKGNKLTNKSYAIPGIVRVDWMNLTKKFDQENLERYSLDFVAKHYLGEEEGKLEYLSEFKSLDELYDEDYNRFIDYNMKDVMLLVELEKKKSYVDISLQLAYLTHALPENIYSNTRLWDVYIYNTLLAKNIIIPKDKQISKSEKYEGAFVTKEEDLKRGLHDWVIIRDVASEYPSAMISANMSALSKMSLEHMTPELQDAFDHCTVENFLAGKITEEHTALFKKHNVSCAPEGAMFSNEKEDFIAKMLSDLFTDRMAYRAKAKEKGISDKEKLKCEQLVYSIKILMNSLYGAVGSEYFRYGDVKVAMSVTKLGQIVLRYAGQKVTDYFKNKFNYDPWLYSDTDSVAGDSTVIIDTIPISIENLFERERLTGNVQYHMTSSGREFVFPKNVKTNFFDEADKKVKTGNIQYIEKHLTRKRKFIIKTKSGKVIEVTEDHSIMVLDKKGKLVEKKPNELIPYSDRTITIKTEVYPRMNTEYIEDEIIEVIDCGFSDEHFYDIGMVDTPHTFFANDILVHNSVFFKMAPVVEDWKKSHKPNATYEDIIKFLDMFDKKIIDPIIKQAFQEVVDKLNLFRNHFTMLKEKTCNRILLSKPKHYILSLVEKEGKIFEDPKYTYKGIEIVRTSTPAKVRSILKDTMRFLFTICKDEQELFDYITKVKETIWDKLTINEMSFPRGVSDMTEDWKPAKYDVAGDSLVFKKGTPVAVKAAWVYNFTIDKLKLKNKYPMLRNRDKVKWIYMKMPNPFHSPVVAFSETYYFPKHPAFDIEKYMDKDLQFQKAYFDVVQRIVEAIGWNISKSVMEVETLF